MSSAQRLRLFHAETDEPPAHYPCVLSVLFTVVFRIMIPSDGFVEI